MPEVDRDSFDDLKRAAFSKRVQAFFGVLFTVIGSTYAWIQGFDGGLKAAGVDIKELDGRVDALELRASANEVAAGETLAQLIAAEQRLAEMRQREQARDQAAAVNAKNEERAEYERWHAIVMSNAPKNRSDAYERSYKANYDAGNSPMTAAHMTLGWGSVGR